MVSFQLRDQLRVKMKEHLRDYYGERAFDAVPNEEQPNNNDTAGDEGAEHADPAPHGGRAGISPLEEALMQMRRAWATISRASLRTPRWAGTTCRSA